MDIFLIINNLLILFAMIAVGFFAGKSGKLSDKAFSDLTAFLMQVTLPCMIFSSMQRAFDINMLKDSVIGLVLSLVFTLSALGISYLVSGALGVRKIRRGTWIFASTYGNTGFMGIPIVNALLGQDGVFILANSGPAYMIVQYTLCVRMMYAFSGKEPDGGKKNVLLSRQNLAMLLGLLFFLFQIPVPEVASRVINAFAGITTPLSMFVIGLSLSRGRIADTFRDKDVITICLMRLAAIPLLSVLALHFMPFVSPLLKSVLILCAAMPCPSLSVIFSQTYGGDVELGSRAIFLSSLVCMVTIPLMTLLI